MSMLEKIIIGALFGWCFARITIFVMESDFVKSLTRKPSKIIPESEQSNFFYGFLREEDVQPQEPPNDHP